MRTASHIPSALFGARAHSLLLKKLDYADSISLSVFLFLRQHILSTTTTQPTYSREFEQVELVRRAVSMLRSLLPKREKQLVRLGFAKTSCAKRELLPGVGNKRKCRLDLVSDGTRAIGGCVNKHPIGFSLGKDDAVEHSS